MKILHVVGARPNFMKIAPVMKAVGRAGFAEQKLVHTGQHYDVSMSDVFFSDLGMPLPDIHLGVGSGSHAEQTAKVMVGFEKVCAVEQPDLVVVAGDVNSTLACGNRLREAPHSLRASRGWASLVRHGHAGRGEPHRHRPALRSPPHALQRRRREPPP